MINFIKQMLIYTGVMAAGIAVWQLVMGDPPLVELQKEFPKKGSQDKRAPDEITVGDATFANPTAPAIFGEKAPDRSRSRG